MQDRILKTANGQFKTAIWTGQDESKLEPVCDKIVVLPDEAMDKIGSIHMPDELKDRQSLGAVSGLLVSVGPQAFAYDSNRLVKWEGWRPQPGDRIVFSRYSGEEYPGADGRTYRVMQDTCVGAVVERNAGAMEAAA